MNADVNAVLELRDIRGPVAVAGEWWWAGILLVILVVVGIAVFLYHRRIRPVVAVVSPPRAPWEIALEAMEMLERGDLVATQKVKEYYSQLSGIVRQYIEGRFDVRAPEMTTEEFMAAVSSSDKLTHSQHKFLEEFLHASDMVKFAKAVPSLDQMRQGLALARLFVQETR